jgi:hypothetical protein
MSRPKREIWNDAVDEAGERAIEAAASVSVAQAEKELAAAGFDVAAERAKVEAFLDDLARPDAQPVVAVEQDAPADAVEPDPPPALPVLPLEPARRRPRPLVMWLAAAATLAVGGSAIAYVALHPSAPEAIGPAPDESASADLAAAADLRQQALAACNAQRWIACQADLDKAKALDPGGDRKPEIKALRQRAFRRDKPLLK